MKNPLKFVFKVLFYKKVFPKNVDVIISLASSSTNGNGRVRFSYETEELEKIALQAKSLLDDGYAKRILFCGGKVLIDEKGKEFFEWNIMYNTVFPNKKINTCETPFSCGKDTKEKAVKTAKLLKNRGMNSAIVVTSSKTVGNIFCRKLKRENIFTKMKII